MQKHLRAQYLIKSNKEDACKEKKETEKQEILRSISIPLFWGSIHFLL
jgi:hypothetical protein